jgi:hypothetical protein
MIEWGVALNVVEQVQRTIESAARLESGGIDSLWMTDFPAVRSASPLAAAVAENTSRCRIGIGLMSPALYGVDSIARQVLTLIDTFGDRFDVLVGPGDRFALESIGVGRQPGSVIAERTISAARAVKDRISSASEHCRVFLAAQGPRMIQSSTALDGVLLNYSDKEMIVWASGMIRKRNPDFIVGVFPPTHLDASPDFASESAIRRAAAMVALGSAKSVRKEFGLEDSLAPAQRIFDREGKLNEKVLSALDEDTLRRFAVCERTEGLCSYVKQLEELGVAMVVFGPPLCTYPEGLDLVIQARDLCEQGC